MCVRPFGRCAGSVRPVQPLSTAAIRRPFHWGIVIVSAPEEGGAIPDVQPDRAVTGDEHGLIALVRHAQDVESFAEDFDWAEAEVLVRLLPDEAPESADRREVYRGMLHTPSGRVTVGDADSEVIHPAHHGWTHVVVTVDADVPEDDLSPDVIRVDLSPGA